MRALLFARKAQLDLVYGPEQRERLGRLVELEVFAGDYDSAADVADALAETELLFSTWGMKKLDEPLLRAAPRLKAVFYAAGSVRRLVSDAFWQRGIPLCSAWAANAVPVSEMTLGLILLGLKRFFEHARVFRAPGGYHRFPVAGGYKSTVGLIGMGMIGRRVRELLRSFDVRVVAYDPYLSDEGARVLGVEKRSLEALFAESDVVSLHAPNLPETQGMLKAEHFRLMKEGATFINTARGAIVDEPGMIEVLRARPDITALLDVTHPEPPVEGSPLYALPNVILTPHIAGSMDRECWRMADYMIDECERFLKGEPLLYRVTPERLKTMA